MPVTGVDSVLQYSKSSGGVALNMRAGDLCRHELEARRAYVVAVKQPLARDCLLLLHDTGAGLPRRISAILLSSRAWRQRTLSKSNTFRPLSSLHVANLASVGEKEMSLTARVCTAGAR